MCLCRNSLWAAFFVVLFVQVAAGVPPSPSVLERWASEGKLEELASIEREAHLKGVNHLPALKGVRAVTGERGAIVILVDFDDNEADTLAYPISHYEELLFSLGTYPTGSLRDYYAETSYGQLDVTGTVTGWYRMPEDYAYYTNGEYGWGSYPQNAQRLTEHAIAAADPYVDFSEFDNDGPDGIPDSGDDDGYVDALFVVHAGPEGAGGDGWAIWSHAWTTRFPEAVDGVWAYRYSMEPESGRIGVFCHELGHVFGLPDLYDLGYDSRGVGDWSLMASGCWGGSGDKPVHLDAWCKVRLGWVDPIVPTENLTGVEIPAIETDPVIYKLWTDGNPGSEYFLIEFRKQQLFDACVPWKGLVVYHIDGAVSTNDNQCCGSGSPHYKVAVEQADGECDLEYNRNDGDMCDPFPGLLSMCNGGNDAFDAGSSPSSRAYDDHDTYVALRNVTLGGGVITLDMEVESPAAVVSLGEGEACAGLDVCNPFEPGGSIRFYVPEAIGGPVPVCVRIYDVEGRTVRTLTRAARSPGLWETTWDGRDEALRPVASGVYFVVFEASGKRDVAKLLLAR